MTWVMTQVKTWVDHGNNSGDDPVNDLSNDSGNDPFDDSGRCKRKKMRAKKVLSFKFLKKMGMKIKTCFLFQKV